MLIYLQLTKWLAMFLLTALLQVKTSYAYYGTGSAAVNMMQVNPSMQAPKITNDNAQNEYYLTDIVKYVNKIQIYLVPEHFKYQIYGVNTKDELKYLEELIK
jgi:bifunctional N-acetylglucosamine-1-phosphate-uridyltransferase/glucosamine-1-phosphate-acetyltransferase GlmU-like protein